jgi:hypothetical protein
VPSLNTFTAAFHPGRIDASVLVRNALLGLGTALAPVLVAVFVGLGFWWGLPALSALLLIALLGVSLGLPLQTPPAAAATARNGIPTRFWLFAGFAILYGFCETVNGNWSQLDMTRELGASTTVAALALTAFWAMVTVGRIAVAALQRRLGVRLPYHVLPRCSPSPSSSSRFCPRATPASASSRSALRDSGARRSCRSPSTSARSSWRRSPPRWPGA